MASEINIGTKAVAIAFLIFTNLEMAPICDSFSATTLGVFLLSKKKR